MPCKKCGAPIGFHKLASGKWMPVDVTEKGNYRTNMGNHGNLTPVHRCINFDGIERDKAEAEGKLSATTNWER